MNRPLSASTIRHSVVVDAPIETAFKVFTGDFGRFEPPEHNLLAVEIAETLFDTRVGGYLGTAASTAASAAGVGCSPSNLPAGWW